MTPQPIIRPRRDDLAVDLRDRVTGLVDLFHERRLTANLAQALVNQLIFILDVPVSWSRSGHHMKIKEIILSDWDDNTLYVRMNLRYKKTRGFPQYSTTGTARGRFEVTFTDVSEICLSNLVITELNLRRIPNWLDNTWIRDRINSRIPDQLCVPIPETLSLNEIVVDPNPVTGGSLVTCEVHMNGPVRQAGANVDLASSHPAIVTVPARVNFPLAATTAIFPLLTQYVGSNVSVNISASFKGVTKTVTLTIVPLALESVKLEPATVKGGNPTTCTVRLNGVAPAAGAPVTMAVHPQNVASISDVIIVPPGAEVKEEEVPTGQVENLTTITFSATHGAVTKTATLTVVPKKANLIIPTVNFFAQGQGITAPTAGQAFKMCINVVNIGDLQAGASKLRVEMYKSSVGWTIWEKEISPLAPGSGANPCIDVPGLEAGHHYDFNMYADYYNAVNESDEDNYAYYGRGL